MTGWFEARVALGHTTFSALVELGRRDPGGLWSEVGNRIAFTDAGIAEALTAGIARGMGRPRFPVLVRLLLDEGGPEIGAGARPLPATRRLLWATAVALAHLDAIERAPSEWTQ